MDVNLARTFLEVIRSGTFIQAAERLHITQTTVTARIQNLESLLGCTLFIRNKSGATLTDNGQRFIVHATQLIQAWEAARKDLPLPQGSNNVVTIGGEFSLWNPLLLNWLSRLRTQLPTLALRVEVSELSTLLKNLESGLMDAIIVHQPEYWPGIQVEEILEEKLVLVKSVTNPDPYIYVNWGEDFCQQHDAARPEYRRAEMVFNIGILALNYLLENGGTGYFRKRVVEKYIAQGLLERVPHAPEFSYPIYLAYPRNKHSDLMAKIFESLREASHADINWAQNILITSQH